MLAASRDRIESMLGDDALVLDIGAWAKPWPRADWVIDLMPYETRGMYGEPDPEPERFSADTWVVQDICSHEPWPFEDDRFDFVVCSHTLEDVRDPIRVCEEMARVARAGYIEVPSRLEEQAFGIHGPWVGWSHHHWLCDVGESSIEFVFKSAVLQGRPDFRLSKEQGDALSETERVQTLFWEGDFEARERVMLGDGQIDGYLAEGVAGRPTDAERGASLAGRLRRAVRRRL